jgi:hypothetical protein
MAINTTSRKNMHVNGAYPRVVPCWRNSSSNNQRPTVAVITDEQYAVWRDYYCERILKSLTAERHK